jgi:hypothetical protein
VQVPIDAAMASKHVNGYLAPEKIQSVVRAGFDEVRKCYAQGLRASTNLMGRVAIKFVIDTDGSVTSAADEGSELPDPKVIQCVVDAFKTLRFPKPEHGTVVVVYPIRLNPGE